MRAHETRAKKSSPNIYSSQNRLTKAQTSTDEAKKWKKHEKAETPNKWKKHEKAEISKKCQNYSNMQEFLQNVKIAKNARISRIATIYRHFYNLGPYFTKSWVHIGSLFQSLGVLISLGHSANARTHIWFGQMPGGQMPEPF